MVKLLCFEVCIIRNCKKRHLRQNFRGSKYGQICEEYVLLSVFSILALFSNFKLKMYAKKRKTIGLQKNPNAVCETIQKREWEFSQFYKLVAAKLVYEK